MTALPEIGPELLAGWPLPKVAGESDKDARGRVLVVGGGAGALGAALLTGLAALRTGAGRLRLAVPRSVAAATAVAAPEARVLALAETEAGDIAAAAGLAALDLARTSDAVAIGPGLADPEEAAALALGLLAAERPAFVVDAAAMVGLGRESARARGAADRLILTPHAGEMAAFLGIDKDEVQADPVAAGRQAAARLRAVVVMKGVKTFVVSPDGAAWAHRSGAAGLGTSGSGDVLTGLIAGLAARGAPPVQAAAWGVWLHGQAGAILSERIGPLGFLAREIADEVPGLLARVAA